MQNDLRFRVVVRDEHDRIICDCYVPHHAAALPIYDSWTPDPGCRITLQHGARIMHEKRG